MNEADILCNRFEMGHEKTGDTLRLIELSMLGTNPAYYIFDIDTLEIKRKPLREQGLVKTWEGNYPNNVQGNYK